MRWCDRYDGFLYTYRIRIQNSREYMTEKKDVYKTAIFVYRPFGWYMPEFDIL